MTDPVGVSFLGPARWPETQLPFFHGHMVHVYTHIAAWYTVCRQTNTYSAHLHGSNTGVHRGGNSRSGGGEGWLFDQYTETSLAEECM